MNTIALNHRRCAVLAGVAVAFLALLPCVAVAKGPDLPGVTPDLSDPGGGGLWIVHNDGKLSVASIRGSPDGGSGFSALLPPGLTPRVPEPGTLGLLALGAPFLLRRRQRP